jgi:hypothetical protein
MPIRALGNLEVPTTQLLFGSDFPAEPIKTTVTEIPALKLSPGA